MDSNIVLPYRTSRSEVTEGTEVLIDELAYRLRDGFHGWFPDRRCSLNGSRSGSDGVGMKVRPRSRISCSDGDR